MRIAKILAVVALALALPLTTRADITIADEGQLRIFAAAVNSGTDYNGESVFLTQDITLTSGWTPIGTAGTPFKGHFEGWGHKISNLNVSGGDYAGLFGHVDGGSIRDVAVVSGAVSGSQYVGAICGYVINSGEISSCYATINVSGSKYVGGICGFFNGSEIKDCYYTGTVTSTLSGGNYFLGGIVGQLYGGSLRNCYMTGNINCKTIADHVYTYAYYGSIAGDQKSSQTNSISNSIYLSSIDIMAIGDKDDDDDGYIGTPYNDGNNVVGSATASDMQTATYWSGVLNTETYNAAWKIADGSYPQLNSFIKNQPITFNFTATKQWLTIVPNGNYAVPAGMKAYIVTGVDVASGTVSLRSVSTLNEGRGALVWSEGGESITAYPTQGALSDYSDDQWLKGSHVSPVNLKGDKTEYVLSGGIFQRSKSGTLARNKAYLKVPASSGSNSLKVIIEEDDATGVVSQESRVKSQCSMVNGQSVYDLSGRKVNGQLTKGHIYINNGKKIIIR
ncbi:MAG: hypothetical protein J6X27_01275 [Bacteroidaceae bacterium]|nr:hypothetical protein [Bacteroidaceae bacterium]